MEGRLPNEWEEPLDVGKVKIELGFGPLDRMLLFVGPLEHSAGVDLLVEALPVALGRARNLRICFVGSGSMHDHLYNRANALNVGHSIRVLTAVQDPLLKKAFRSAEALILPSRERVQGDDHMVTWARRAGRPVVTTHAGPAGMVRHEENGIVTYDNPGSIVWALDRILGDAAHSDRMGRNGKQQTQEETNSWTEVARRYLELCAGAFPELT
jgi:glycosyltransferase involved in cell wall biosynthesis